MIWGVVKPGSANAAWIALRLTISVVPAPVYVMRQAGSLSKFSSCSATSAFKHGALPWLQAAAPKCCQRQNRPGTERLNKDEMLADLAFLMYHAPRTHAVS